jgi:hypothetical protein
MIRYTTMNECKQKFIFIKSIPFNIVNLSINDFNFGQFDKLHSINEPCFWMIPVTRTNMKCTLQDYVSGSK